MPKPLILVVDDEKDFTDDVVEKLNKDGRYAVKAVNSARDAFAVLEKSKWFLDIPANKVACILLDIKMPDMDGMQFLEKLWQIRKAEYKGGELSLGREKAFIPVIILSAFEDVDKWENTPGKLEYLRKPLKYEELFPVLDRIITGSRQEWDKMRGDVARKAWGKGAAKY